MTTFKVSVLVPTYNQQDFIEHTLISTLEQDYDNLEVVVSDDFSSDKTPQILKSLEKKYPQRLKVFLYKENLGVTKNHTRGLLECGGEFVAFQDGDDFFLQEKIKRQVAFMVEHPECAIAFHDVDVFDSTTGKTLYLWSERFGHREGGIRKLVRYGNYLPSVSVMVRREHLPSHGYDDRIRIGSDWLLWLEVLNSANGVMCYIPEVLARYQRHSGNLTNTSGWKFEDQLVTLALIDTKWPYLLSASRVRRSEVHFMQALKSVSLKRYADAQKYLIASAIVGFPALMPWFRLVWRELMFLYRFRNADEGILRSFFHQ